MSKQQPQKENAFDMGIAGTTGAMDYAAGYGTPASPDNSQDAAEFTKNKSLGNTSNTAVSAPAQPAANDAQINQIYSKKVTPSPDEVVTGLKYELHNMVKPDKAKAKQIVLQNLRKDPHHYGKLGMLNIDDKDMMNENSMTESEKQMAERIKVLNQMMEAKGKKAEASQAIKDALKDTKDRRNERMNRR